MRSQHLPRVFSFAIFTYSSHPTQENQILPATWYIIFNHQNSIYKFNFQSTSNSDNTKPSVCETMVFNWNRCETTCGILHLPWYTHDQSASEGSSVCNSSGEKPSSDLWNHVAKSRFGILCECTFGQNRNFSAGVRCNWQLIDQAAGEWKTKTRQGRVDGGVDRKNLRRLSSEDLHSQRRRGMIVVSGSTQWHMDDAARANTKRWSLGGGILRCCISSYYTYCFASH